MALVITRGDSIGGAQVHVRDLALALLALGHEVRVMMGGMGPFADELAAASVPYEVIPDLVHPLHPQKDLLASLRLWRAIRQYAPDVIAAHSSKAGILARLVGAIARIPTVFTVHGWAFTEGVAAPRRFCFRLIERLVAPLAARIICVSEYDRSLALRCGVARPAQLVTIHNGIPDVPMVWRAKPGDEPPRAVMVARMAAPKDFETVLHAVAQVPSLALDLVGDGPDRVRLEWLARVLGLQERVVFHGHTPRVHEILARAQVFVLASRYEAFPLSILEAMRAGLPVVATDVGGVQESVAHGETGFLVPARDVAALAQRLRELSADAGLRQRQGGQGRAAFEARFVQSRMVADTLAQYRAALERPSQLHHPADRQTVVQS
ncbi:MAG TPA: glycosyltransferase family 4 protein [Oscillatoriaceae cyanobacterium]